MLTVTLTWLAVALAAEAVVFGILAIILAAWRNRKMRQGKTDEAFACNVKRHWAVEKLQFNGLATLVCVAVLGLAMI